MRNTTPVASRKPNQATRTGEGFFGINIKDLSVEEICERANIQSNILDLQSKDSEKVRSALSTLSSITKFTARKDALYVLVGYYKLEIRTIDEIIDFFHATSMAFSIDLTMTILKDLIKRKELSRRRIFVHDFLQQLGSVFRDTGDDGKEEMRTLIENSAWGDKLKRKFLDHLSYDEF